jgi:hypothetical protein
LSPLCSSQDGLTSLVIAGEHGHVDCVRLLIDSEADKDAKDQVRRRLLARCCDEALFLKNPTVDCV